MTVGRGIRDRVRSTVTFSNIVAMVALTVSISGGVAYATHLEVFSRDIVNGQVKRPDLATDAVNSRKVLDDSLLGGDIDESTLSGLNASKLAGFSANQIVALGGTKKRAIQTLADCTPGIDYETITFTAPASAGGYALINATLVYNDGSVASEAVAARIERTAPSLVVGEWSEDITGGGRRTLPITSVLPVAPGSNTFALKVCDAADDTSELSAYAVAAEITVLFTPFSL